MSINNRSSGYSDKYNQTLAGAFLGAGPTSYDLEEAELCYAPQFGSANDPVNFAGMIAADVLRGDLPLSHWNLARTEFILDVREPVSEYWSGGVLLLKPSLHYSNAPA